MQPSWLQMPYGGWQITGPEPTLSCCFFCRHSFIRTQPHPGIVCDCLRHRAEETPQSHRVMGPTKQSIFAVWLLRKKCQPCSTFLPKPGPSGPVPPGIPLTWTAPHRREKKTKITFEYNPTDKMKNKFNSLHIPLFLEIAKMSPSHKITNKNWQSASQIFN
jgi:hypothetical protein